MKSILLALLSIMISAFNIYFIMSVDIYEVVVYDKNEYGNSLIINDDGKIKETINRDLDIGESLIYITIGSDYISITEDEYSYVLNIIYKILAGELIWEE